MKTIWLSFIASATFAFLAAAPSESNAAEKRFAYSACGTRTETGAYPAYQGQLVTRNGQCPIPDETGFTKASITALNVHFAVGDDYNMIYGPVTRARTCAVDYQSSAQVCGAWAESYSNGMITLSPARTYWDSGHAAWFGVLDYYMQNDGYYGSQLQGYYTAN